MKIAAQMITMTEMIIISRQLKRNDSQFLYLMNLKLEDYECITIEKLFEYFLIDSFQ